MPGCLNVRIKTYDLDLLNAEQNFWKRIDYVFLKYGSKESKNRCIKWVNAEVTGDEVIDKTPSGLWPSDHGGVYVEMSGQNEK